MANRVDVMSHAVLNLSQLDGIWRVLSNTRALLPLLTVFLTSSCVLSPPFYAAEDITGQVLDAETAEPLAGAVVVAAWLPVYVDAHTDLGPAMQVREAETDERGFYTIPGWGLRLRRPLTYLDDEDPRITVFKAGYEPFSKKNARESNSAMRRSDWNGKQIRLRRFRGTTEQRLDALRFLVSNAFGLWTPAVSDSRLLKEILREHPLHKNWPAAAQPYFRNIRRLMEKTTR
jgi:hypothetical protein